MTNSTPNISSSITNKKYLEDVVILRLILIFLLIWNHAFAPYSGHWDSLPNQEDIPLYKWLVYLVYNMRIQALIFISGYLLGYTSIRKPESLLFKNCIGKKIKRLLLPSIIFSTLYYILFYNLNHPIGTITYSIINGCGHMWFLPMLFLCFVGVYIVEKLKIKPFIVLIISIIAAIIPLPDIPLRIDRTLQYFIFFYLGFGIQRQYFNFCKPQNSIKPILLCIVIYIVTFIINYWVISYVVSYTNDIISSFIQQENIRFILSKGGELFLYRICSFIMSISGLLAAFWSANYFVVGKYKLPRWLIKLSTYCYGVYICQQFILISLYYHSDLAKIIGFGALPWVALLLTLILSLLITHLLLLTKTGRYLLG